MNKIKSLVAGVAAAMLAIVLIACGGQKQETTDTPTGQPEGGAITGGWTIPEEYGTTFTDDELAIFDSAMGGLVGVDYKPVTVIATQVVAGTNRAYLCRGTLVTPEGGECWYVVTIYTNLEGKSEILDIKELDFVNPIFFTGEADGQMTGAWQIVKPNGYSIPTEAAEALSKATEGTVGYSYTPIALLGTQVVSGTNYRILAYGEPVTPDAQGALHILEIYVSLDGNAEITSMGQLDITAYV